jgi:hypothetical protein
LVIFAYALIGKVPTPLIFGGTAVKLKGKFLGMEDKLQRCSTIKISFFKRMECTGREFPDVSSILWESIPTNFTLFINMKIEIFIFY